MQDILPSIDRWLEQGKPVALATVIHTWGSSPRGVGAKMVITIDGDMAGSVSGGCVEGAVVDAGIETLKTGASQLLHFGISNDAAWDVGLACGGELEILVHPLDVSKFSLLREAWEKGVPVASAVVIKGPVGLLGHEVILTEERKKPQDIAHSQDERIEQIAQEALRQGTPRCISLPLDESDTLEIFVDVIQPPPALVIVGGVHIAIPLVSFANILGYRTVVVDPRRKFGSPERFPHANQLINAWPDEAFSRIQLHASTAVTMLTHDPKIDDPALMIALSSRAFYVGALGSRKTQAQRCQRLLEMGLTQAQINRLRGPIGLDLGGHSPEEIALAVMAEIVQVFRKLNH